MAQAWEVKAALPGDELRSSAAASLPQAVITAPPPAAGRHQFRTVYTADFEHSSPAILAQSFDGEWAVLGLRHNTIRYARGARLLLLRRDSGVYRSTSIQGGRSVDPLAAAVTEDGRVVVAVAEPGKKDNRLVQRVKIISFPVDQPAQVGETAAGSWEAWHNRIDACLSADGGRAAVLTGHHLKIFGLHHAADRFIEEAELFVREPILHVAFLDGNRKLAAVLAGDKDENSSILRIWELPRDGLAGPEEWDRLMQLQVHYDEPVERICASPDGLQLAVVTRGGVRLYGARTDEAGWSLAIKGLFSFPDRACITALQFDRLGHCLYAGRDEGVLSVLATQHIEDGEIVEVRHFPLNEPVQAIAAGVSSSLISLRTTIEEMTIRFFKARGTGEAAAEKV